MADPLDMMRDLAAAERAAAPETDPLSYFLSRDNTPPTIARFRGEHEYLSNPFHAPIVYRGLVYKSTEYLFQAMKATNVADREEIRNAPTWREAKQIAHDIALPEWWNDERETMMMTCLWIKFTQHLPLAVQLKATGNATLIEGNTWHDNIWGHCTCNNASGRYPRCDHRVAGLGQNLLGQLLMAMRSTL